jgi:hypothetical protein
LEYAQPRQGLKGVGDADALAGRVQVQPHAPGEPLRARAETSVPAAAGVELADEAEQARGGGVEMRGQLGDLVAQPVQLLGALRGLHGASPPGGVPQL